MKIQLTLLMMKIQLKLLKHQQWKHREEEEVAATKKDVIVEVDILNAHTTKEWVTPRELLLLAWFFLVNRFMRNSTLYKVRIAPHLFIII